MMCVKCGWPLKAGGRCACPPSAAEKRRRRERAAKHAAWVGSVVREGQRRRFWELSRRRIEAQESTNNNQGESEPSFHGYGRTNAPTDDPCSICEHGTQKSRCEACHFRALYRESVARGLELMAERATLENIRCGEFHGFECSCRWWIRRSFRDWDSACDNHAERAARLLRRWAESVRTGRDMPGWRGQP